MQSNDRVENVGADGPQGPDPFRVGDVVCLQSGGHVMTVVTAGCCMVGAAWSGEYGIEEAEFPIAALMLAGEHGPFQ